MSKRLRWFERPVRVCRYFFECCLCKQRIVMGEAYHDGGYGKRAHLRCAPKKCDACDGSGRAPPAFPRFHAFDCGYCDGSGEAMPQRPTDGAESPTPSPRGGGRS